MPIVSSGQFTITDVNDSPLALLSNESVSVPSNPDGSSPILTGAATTISVMLGGVDDSANWVYAATPSSGVTGTLATRTYTVSGLTVDSGFADITATRVGWPVLTKRFTLGKAKQGVTGATGAAGINGLNFSEAKLLFTDPTFQSGSNGLSVYNNMSNGTVTHTRIAKLADSPFSDSGFNIEVANTGAASPGIGGFIHGITSRASAVFVQRIVAKVPLGYSLEQATNPTGDGGTNTWITSKLGTGKFEEYLLVRRCGATGTFGASGHIYAIGANGSPGTPVKWWLAYTAVYDFTALGFSTVVGLLSNDSHTVPTDSAGNGGNFTGAATTMSVFNGTVDDSANWTVAASPSNVTGTLSGKTYTVTALSADTGFVDLTASRGGFSNVVKRFTLTKSKGGVTGATGAQGPAAVVTPNRAATFTATDGVLNGAQADIVFTAATSGVTSPTYVWTFSGLQTNPTASTTNAQTVTAAQFGTATSATVTCTVSGAYADTVTVIRLEKSTAAAGANQTYVDASGNIQGVTSGAGLSIANNQDSVIRNPVGGVFTTTGGTLTGRLKIKLPQLHSSTMMRFTVEIYEYISGYSCTLEIAGYNYSAGWINCTARVIGGSNVEYPVYFGRDADKNCVWIGGATTETWSYPQVRVRDFFAGYSNFSRTQWETGWAISFDQTAIASGASTVANTYNVLIADTLPGADWAKTSGVGKPANNATVGAPYGTAVNGVMAEVLTAQANTSTALLADISSDNKLTPVEKQQVQLEWGTLAAEREGLLTQAYTLNVSAESATYAGAFAALQSYLVPLLAALGSTSDVDGPTLRSFFLSVYTSRQALVNRMLGLAVSPITLRATAPGFTFYNAFPSPASQWVGFSVGRSGLIGPVRFFASNGASLASGADLADTGHFLLGTYGAGDDTSAYMSIDQFGGAASVTVTAECAGSSASVLLARLAETDPAPGANAYASVFDPVFGLDRRMRANADNVLGGVLSTDATTVPVGLRVGTVTWNAAGVVTGGTGVAITPAGILARNASKTSFALDAITGNATFSGDLTGANITGATGTFSGMLTAETLGSLGQAPVTVSASQSVTVPAGMTSVRYELMGGGGGGGGGATAFATGYGGGGGSGGYMAGTLTVTPGASLAVVIGTGGAGGGNTAAGGDGVASTLGGVVSAAGGGGGGGSAAGGGFGAGGAAGASVPSGKATAGLVAARNYDGANTTHSGYGKYDGEAKYNGSGFPAVGVTGAGGASPVGSGGLSQSTGVGNAGTGWGSGGSGGGGSLSTNVTATGGAGRPGVVILTFFNGNGVVLQSQLEALKSILAGQGISVS